MNPTYTPTPLIIAHRGASRECLENTLAAFDRALEQGADGIELDVHATSDGVVVVHHDPVVRDAREGHAGLRAVIADTTFAALSELRLINFEPVPTLDTVLARVGSRATVFVEVKGDHIESLVIECLARHSDTATAVHSFDHRIALAFRERIPKARTGVLSASYAIDVAHEIRMAHANDYWQHTSLIDQALVNAVHAAGARVIAWTENDVQHARELAHMGVDALCTDIPKALRAAFTENR